MSKMVDIAVAHEQCDTAPATNNDVIAAAGDLLGAISLSAGTPVDYDGSQINVLRCPDSHKLIAVIISPVDMCGDEPMPRYTVEMGQVARAPKKIVLG